MTMEKFVEEMLYPEKLVAEVAGLTREVMKNARGTLEKGRDWGRKRTMVMFTETGLRNVAAMLGLEQEVMERIRERVQARTEGNDSTAPAEVSTKDDKKGGSCPGETDIELVRLYPNRRIVGGRLDGEVVRIRVKDNRNFRRGMILPCRHVQADLWECTRRSPRRRGKW